jgi:hypothetical protein
MIRKKDPQNHLQQNHPQNGGCLRRMRKDAGAPMAPFGEPQSAVRLPNLAARR